MTYAPLARQSSDASYNGERLVNYIAHPSSTFAPLALLGREGLEEIHRIGNVTAMLSTERALYVVAGGALWEAMPGEIKRLGSVSEGVATMAASHNQVAVVAGGVYWLYDGNELSQYETGSIDVPRGVIFREGYFVVWGESLGREDGIQPSQPGDGKTFNALDIVFAELAGDAIVSCVSAFDRIWAVGTRTIQFFTNQGTYPGPFRPTVGTSIGVGCSIGPTVAAGTDGLYFVGEDSRIYATQGIAPREIGTPELYSVLGEIEDAFIYTERGHRFYVIVQKNGPSFAYDKITGLWSERTTGVNEGRWIAHNAVEWRGDTYFGTGSGISISRPDLFTDNGEVIVAEVVTPPLENAGQPFRIKLLDIVFATGEHDIGREGEVTLEKSQDGRTWGTPQGRYLGRLGDYRNRTRWHSLGRFIRAQFRVRITDEICRDINGAAYE